VTCKYLTFDSAYSCQIAVGEFTFAPPLPAGAKLSFAAMRDRPEGGWLKGLDVRSPSIGTCNAALDSLGFSNNTVPQLFELSIFPKSGGRPVCTVPVIEPKSFAGRFQAKAKAKIGTTPGYPRTVDLDVDLDVN